MSKSVPLKVDSIGAIGLGLSMSPLGFPRLKLLCFIILFFSSTSFYWVTAELTFGWKNTEWVDLVGVSAVTTEITTYCISGTWSVSWRYSLQFKRVSSPGWCPKLMCKTVYWLSRHRGNFSKSRLRKEDGVSGWNCFAWFRLKLVKLINSEKIWSKELKGLFFICQLPWVVLCFARKSKHFY